MWIGFSFSTTSKKRQCIMSADVLRSFISDTLQGNSLPCSVAAVELLIMIAAHESAGFYYVKQVHGSALGLFQMEPIGFAEVHRYMRLRPEKFEACSWLLGAPFELLNFDQEAAVLAGRIYLMAKPEPLPEPEDLFGLSSYAKRYWNTVSGKATAHLYLEAYNRYG